MDRNIIVIGTGRVMQIVLSLVSVRLFTMLLSPSQVGNLFLINSIIAFFGLVLINPVGMYLNRRLHHWFSRGRMPDVFFVFNLYLMGVSLVSLPIVLFLTKVLHVGSGLNVMVLMTFVMMNIYVSSWNQTIIPALNMLQHRKSFVAFSLLTTIIGLACSVIFVSLIERGALWWLLGQVSAQSVVTIAAFVYFHKITRAKISRGIARRNYSPGNIKYAFNFVLPLAVTTLFWWLQNQSYRMIVEHIVGLEYLAMIGLGLSIAANISAAVESLVQQFYYPIYYGQINTDDKATRQTAWEKMAGFTLPIYVSTAIFAALLSPFIVSVLAGPRYQGVTIYVVIGALIELFRASSGLLASVAHAELKTRYLVKPYFIGALCAVAGVYFGARQLHSQVFIPLALVLSGFMVMIVMFFEMNRVMPIQFNWPALARSFLMSLPLVAVLAAYHLSQSLVVSVAVCAVSGIYFIGSQYLMLKGSFGGGKAHG
ncbi:hypothetical protein HY768_09015 [candidate division TA06 bacterium]|uniref:Uncharacterized protein n=1 Tax=candidate division TA06 bacterium TaxID=2250710 RepID=A0A933MK51_UNCT6|nr:hypothetical protein [candidate division TA06 bacterium]